MIIKNMLYVLLVSSLLYAQESPPEGAWAVINEMMKGKNTFEDQFNEFKTDFGFKSNTSLSNLSIGEPFKTFRLDYNALSNASNTTPVATILAPSFVWSFPILEDGQMKMRIEIRNTNGNWERGTCGATWLMPEWQKITNIWTTADGFHPVLINTGMGLYFHVPEFDAFNLTLIKIKSDANGIVLKKMSTSHYNQLDANVTNLAATYNQTILQGRTEDKK